MSDEEAPDFESDRDHDEEDALNFGAQMDDEEPHEQEIDDVENSDSSMLESRGTSDEVNSIELALG